MSYGLKNEGIKMQGLTLTEAVQTVHCPTWNLNAKGIPEDRKNHDRGHIIFLYILKAHEQDHPDIKAWLEKNLYQGSETFEPVSIMIESYLNLDPQEGFKFSNVDEMIIASSNYTKSTLEGRLHRARGKQWASTYIGNIQNKDPFQVQWEHKFDAIRLAKTAIGLYTERDEKDFFYKLEDEIKYTDIFDVFDKKDQIKIIYNGLMPILHHIKTGEKTGKARQEAIEELTVNQIIDLTTAGDVKKTS